MEIEDVEIDKLVNRLNRAYGCFLIWKYIKKSISIPDSGQKEAVRRNDIMNRYGGIFTGILYAVESTFITDLYKLFDKSKGGFKLETLIKKLSDEDQKEARSLVKSVEEEIRKIGVLRHNFTAHEPQIQVEEKIFVQEIEKVFSVVQKIINLISQSIGKESMIWDCEDNTNQSFSCLLDDLELGYGIRMSNLE